MSIPSEGPELCLGERFFFFFVFSFLVLGSNPGPHAELCLEGWRECGCIGKGTSKGVLGSESAM
jgi:hypothetical protein